MGRVHLCELRLHVDGSWTQAYGLYQDRYRRRDGAWRIASRRYSSLARLGERIESFPPSRDRAVTGPSGPLAGKAVVVTGSSMGIGRAVAIHLAEHGARLVLNGSRDSDALDSAVAQAQASGAEAIGVLGSVADEAVAAELVATCVDAYGTIDGLVNVAGIAEPPRSSILTIDTVDWRRLIDVHLHGTFHTCRAAVPHMVAAGGGAIVNTGSHASQGIYGGTGYGAAKGATVSLSRQIALDLAPHGVRCNVVAPGAATRLSTGDEYTDHIEDLHARGLLDDGMRDASLAPPPAEDAAALYAYLVSDLAVGVTGRTFTAAGAYVGVWSDPGETMVAYRDHEGPWDLDEIHAAMGRAGLDAPSR